MTFNLSRYAVTPTNVRRWLREAGYDATWEPRHCDGCDDDASAVGRAQRGDVCAAGVRV